MIGKALNRSPAHFSVPDAEWVTRIAAKLLAAVEERRSTWQSWHIRAEAQRHLRAVQVPTDNVDQLVELLVEEVLQTRSVALIRTEDGISEPAALRRADGSSVYTVAGSELFTSTRILAAEQRLVTTAGCTDGRSIDAPTVELALLESAANGLVLDAGQAGLVRSMATSGARLQLAIAPAGSRKNYGITGTHVRVARRRRPRDRVGSVGRRGGAAPRCHRCTSRNVGEADLVH
jgi:hypothetical protein